MLSERGERRTEMRVRRRERIFGAVRVETWALKIESDMQEGDVNGGAKE